MKHQHDHNDPRLDPARQQPGEAGYRPSDRRPSVPLAMVKPVCQRADCAEEATQVPVAVLRPEAMAVLADPSRDYTVRTPFPTSALCGRHALELRDEPDMLISFDGWIALRKMLEQNGSLAPDRNLLAWEFEPIPSDEQLARVKAERAEARGNKLRREAVN